MVYKYNGGLDGRLMICEQNEPVDDVRGIGIIQQGDPVLGTWIPDDEIPALISALKAHLAAKPTRIENDYSSDGELVGCHEVPI